MSPLEIDLTLDSDSDSEHPHSPGITVLASFGPRKQREDYRVQSQSRSASDSINGEFENPTEDATLPALLRREVQSSTSQGCIARTEEQRMGFAGDEVFRKERAVKAREFQEQRLQKDARGSWGITERPNRSLDYGPKSGVYASAQQSPRFKDSAISICGLCTQRPIDRPIEVSSFHNGVKRSLSNSDKRDMRLSSTKKARIETKSERVVLNIEPESPERERVSYSDEPESPVRDHAAVPQNKPRLPVSRATTTPARKEVNPKDFPNGLRGKGEPYTREEDALLKRLKEEDGLTWDEITPHFNGRTRGSLQVRYSTKISRQSSGGGVPSVKSVRMRRDDSTLKEHTPDVNTFGRPKSDRKKLTQALKGFELDHEHMTQSRSTSTDAKTEPNPLLVQDRVHLNSLSRVLRLRELGYSQSRSWSTSRTLSEELKNCAMADYGLQRRHHGTSGDVVGLSWSKDGNHFAAGSIAITDCQSMQYNMGGNLLLGNINRGELQELVEHHITRPKIDDAGNVNRLHAMAASQDARLFMTVSATAFAPQGDRLYTIGTDSMMRSYALKDDQSPGAKCLYEVQHSASVDLLAVKAGDGDVVATGCHASSDNITVLRCMEGTYEQCAVLSPRRFNLESRVDIFPSTLEWGIAPRTEHLLLAGFSGDEEKQQAGESCLWDGNTGLAIELHSSTRNVFDVAWNPIPSPASVLFAVAANPSGVQIGRRMHTAIHCFAPNQNAGRRIMTWECPAVDINDLVFCPYDENLIAAGATDGSVYVWDMRFAGHSSQPLHTLRHGTSENVLAHDRDVELADTGVRFLSWGTTKSRLYSGSSDGVVKIWNPYRSVENAYVDDLEAPVQRRSAIMSGSFSPDYQNLLIGTENGQISQYRVGSKGECRVQSFKLRSAAPPVTENDEPFVDAHNMVRTGQIELRPFGAMPIRQAVQGPNYQGPSFCPTKDEILESERARRQSPASLTEVTTHQAIHSFFDEEIPKANNETEDKIKKARREYEDLLDRKDRSHKADAFQKSLLVAEEERKSIEKQCPTNPCKLACSVFPRQDQDEPEDSGRSEFRIPEALRSFARHTVPPASEERDYSCTVCFPRNASKGKRLLCGACKLKLAGLTSSCTGCGRPMRVPLDGATKMKCEVCSFSCLRCSRALEVQPDVASVFCGYCKLGWEAGVLGYDLVRQGTTRYKPVPSDVSLEGQRNHDDDIEVDEEEESNDNNDGIGIDDIEYYASLWQDKDGSVA